MSMVLDEQDDAHEFELFTRWLGATVALAAIAVGDADLQEIRDFARAAYVEAMKGAQP